MKRPRVQPAHPDPSRRAQGWCPWCLSVCLSGPAPSDSLTGDGEAGPLPGLGAPGRSGCLCAACNGGRPRSRRPARPREPTAGPRTGPGEAGEGAGPGAYGLRPPRAGRNPRGHCRGVEGNGPQPRGNSVLGGKALAPAGAQRGPRSPQTPAAAPPAPFPPAPPSRPANRSPSPRPGPLGDRRRQGPVPPGSGGCPRAGPVLIPGGVPIHSGRPRGPGRTGRLTRSAPSPSEGPFPRTAPLQPATGSRPGPAAPGTGWGGPSPG